MSLANDDQAVWALLSGFTYLSHRAARAGPVVKKVGEKCHTHKRRFALRCKR